MKTKEEIFNSYKRIVLGVEMLTYGNASEAMQEYADQQTSVLRQELEDKIKLQEPFTEEQMWSVAEAHFKNTSPTPEQFEGFIEGLRFSKDCVGVAKYELKLTQEANQSPSARVRDLEEGIKESEKYLDEQLFGDGTSIKEAATLISKLQSLLTSPQGE